MKVSFEPSDIPEILDELFHQRDQAVRAETRLADISAKVDAMRLAYETLQALIAEGRTVSQWRALVDDTAHDVKRLVQLVGVPADVPPDIRVLVEQIAGRLGVGL